MSVVEVQQSPPLKTLPMRLIFLLSFGMHSRFMRVLACCLQLGVCLSARADDWPQFRGPTGDGISTATNVPLVWNQTNNLAWKTSLPGSGRSSPVILGERIWLTTAFESGIRTYTEGPGQMRKAERVELGVVCLDRQTGKQLFCVRVLSVTNPAAVNSLNSYATPTPVVEPGRVYGEFGSFGTVCLDAANGKVLWQRRFAVDDAHGPSSSPVLYRNLLILTRDGRDRQFIVALDKMTGETVWQRDRPPIDTPIHEFRKAFSTPLIIESQGRTQLVSVGAQWMVAYEPETGNELWRVNDLKGESGAPRPVYGHGMVFYSTGVINGHPQLWAVRTDGLGDVTDTHVAWKLTTQLGFMPSPLLLGDKLYLLTDEGFIACVDANTGKTIGKARAGGTYAASPVYADGRIYLFSRDAKTMVFEAGPELKLLAENQLSGIVFATPAILDSEILLRTDTELYCLVRGPAEKNE